MTSFLNSFDLPSQYQGFFSNALDRERRSIYRLWLAATDSDSPPKSSITSVDIVVEDENDNKPFFDKVCSNKMFFIVTVIRATVICVCA